MFSGIIEGLGELVSVKFKESTKKKGARVRILWNDIDSSDIRVGDSVAVSGVCLTVIKNDEKSFESEVSKETLDLTCGLNLPGSVNLEKAIKYSDRIGGHLITGHVDGIAKIVSITQIESSRKIDIVVPSSYAKFISKKGSIAINGVSLTVNNVSDLKEGCLISINLIPHTWLNTSFTKLESNSPVNFEIDLIARNLYRLIKSKEII